MNVDQHLHRAAHRVRELDVDTPEFVAGPSAAQRYGPGIMAGLLLVGGTATVMTQPPTAAEPAVSDAAFSTDFGADAASVDLDVDAAPAIRRSTFSMTVQEELALIRSAADDATTEPVVLEFRIPDGAS